MFGVQTASGVRKSLVRQIRCKAPTLLKWLQTWSLASFNSYAHACIPFTRTAPLVTPVKVDEYRGTRFRPQSMLGLPS